MNWTRISDTDNRYFNECWDLYESAFPEEERREKNYQLETLNKHDYNMEAVVCDEEFVGFVAWWNFDEWRYIEHFAVAENKRSGGFGSKILKDFINRNNKQVILEIEHLDNELQKRRANFYSRLGFHLNPHHYSHPPYRGSERVNLLIMTHPQPITSQNLNDFCNKYHPEVFFRME